MLRDSQVWQLFGHDPPRSHAGNDAVLGKVLDAGMLVEEILVEEELAVDDGGRRSEDGEDGVGEDGGFAEIIRFLGIFLCELLCGG